MSKITKKRKRDQPEPDAVPANADVDTSSPPPTVGSSSKKSKGRAKQERSERRAKKKKDSNKTSPEQNGEQAEDAKSTDRPKKSKQSTGTDLVEGSSKTEVTLPPSKKRKSTSDQQPDLEVTKKSKKTHAPLADEQTEDTEDPEPRSGKSPARFIVFVGNLPFDATAGQVTQHFVKLAPSSVRLSTDKQTGRSKGFAFVEFDGYDKMKTCLSLYHHSIFDPESKGKTTPETSKTGVQANGEKLRGRRINVELTAGGGGKKSQGRRDRIESKNKKLSEQRERRRIKEMKERGEGVPQKKEVVSTGANTAQPDNGDIHPSRLAQMRY
ncbi:hypothetical protein B0A52_05299 [Exophiala mesophila]|uniref:RRM domain-containing protein n=1 Tax=Exophiala mesophila TaxID=212818 RepID=A0A438N4J8_EXOME|nr:hypothetical protein B0A52_05299 [Exophiala mesophila]